MGIYLKLYNIIRYFCFINLIIATGRCYWTPSALWPEFMAIAAALSQTTGITRNHP